MRIIAGEHRGRRLLGPVDANTTRPITDRVKTSLFDRLAAAGRLEDAVVLDLFSGTGSMGLECLSRGAQHVTFVERDRVARQRLEKNLEAIEARDRSTINGGDALSAVLLPALRYPLNLLFIDPPYRMVEDDKQAEAVVRQMSRLAEAATPGARMMLRTPKYVSGPAVDGWAEAESRNYGSMNVHSYELADKQAQA